MTNPNGPQWQGNWQGGNAWGGSQPGQYPPGFNGQPYPSQPYPGQPYGQPHPYIYGEPRPRAGSLSPDDDRTYAILAHIASPVGMLFSVGWLGFIGPLIVWLLFKDRSPYVREASARSFNFSLGMTIASIVAWICLITVILAPVAAVIWLAVLIMEIYYPIKAAIQASHYQMARYPFSVRLLS